MNRDLKNWILLVISWIFIGYLLSGDLYVAFALLLTPFIIVAVGGLILARLKHHGFDKQVEHDALEVGLSVTAGALAFCIVAVLILALIPSGAGLRLFALYSIVILPASVAFGITSYWTAKHFANTSTHIGGMIGVVTTLLVAALIIGLFCEATLFTPDRMMAADEFSYTLPESEYPVLQDIAELHNEASVWTYMKSGKHPWHGIAASGVHELMKTYWVGYLEESYIGAQHSILAKSLVNGTILAEQECFHEAYSEETLAYRSEATSNWFESAPWMLRRIAETSEMSDGLEDIDAVARRSVDSQQEFKQVIYQGIETDEDPASVQARYDILYPLLPWECKQAVKQDVLL